MAITAAMHAARSPRAGTKRLGSTPPHLVLSTGWGGVPLCQNVSDEPLLLKIFVCVTVTSAGPTHAATLLDPVV